MLSNPITLSASLTAETSGLVTTIASSAAKDAFLKPSSTPAGQSIIIIDGVEKLNGCSHRVIPDRIEAGTFLIASAATLSSITISPVIPQHLESVLEKLRESGSSISIKKDSISIKTDYIKPTDIETAPFPGFPTDLQAPFTALMSIADGDSKITETIFEKRMSHINLSLIHI